MMTPFEQEWYDKYMRNMATAETLQKLVAAGRLTQDRVNEWVAERQDKYRM